VPDKTITVTVYNVPYLPNDFSYNNPLHGRAAFVKDSHGFVSSRYNLSSLAGKTVRFRWILGADFIGGSLGWVIDDVSIYTCVAFARHASLEPAGQRRPGHQLHPYPGLGRRRQ